MHKSWVETIRADFANRVRWGMIGGPETSKLVETISQHAKGLADLYRRRYDAAVHDIIKCRVEALKDLKALSDRMQSVDDVRKQLDSRISSAGEQAKDHTGLEQLQWEALKWSLEKHVFYASQPDADPVLITELSSFDWEEFIGKITEEQASECSDAECSGGFQVSDSAWLQHRLKKLLYVDPKDVTLERLIQQCNAMHEGWLNTVRTFTNHVQYGNIGGTETDASKVVATISQSAKTLADNYRRRYDAAVHDIIKCRVKALKALKE